MRILCNRVVKKKRDIKPQMNTEKGQKILFILKSLDKVEVIKSQFVSSTGIVTYRNNPWRVLEGLHEEMDKLFDSSFRRFPVLTEEIAAPKLSNSLNPLNSLN